MKSTLRQRLLWWHYKKAGGVQVLDLLDSNYQQFRHMVSRRVGVDLNFRDAIKQANEDELMRLDNIRLEDKLGI